MTALETALNWRSHGIAVIPILARSKRPAISKWKPYQHRLPSESELRLWFSNGYSLAVITGWRHLVVIDWDDMGKYVAWLDDLAPELAHLVFETYRVWTGRGLHIYLMTKAKTRTMPGDGVDVKAEGGYVLAPPSIHPSGRRYQAEGNIEDIQHLDSIDELLPPPPPPSWEPRHTDLKDPFDAAMCKSANFSQVEKIQSRWCVEDLLPGLPHHRGLRMVDCPFHADSHASLAVYPDGHMHCFGCGFHASNVVGLYAGLHKIDLWEAIREMGGTSG